MTLGWVNPGPESDFTLVDNNYFDRRRIRTSEVT